MTSRGDLPLLLRHLGRAHGLRFDLYREKCLRRRLERRLRVHGIRSYGEYLRYLRSDPREAERLKAALTIPVSRFFRNASSFHALERLALPEILRLRRGERVRMWSAGAARGEEAYSLAILWDRFTGGDPGAPRLTVLATDLDASRLEQAREGRYDTESLAEVRTEDVGRYFSREGDEFRVVPRIRERVAFRTGDLAAGPRVRGQDLIACRNVLIYFGRDLQEVLGEAFHRALRPGGYLLLGKVETLPASARRLFEVVDVGERLFRKPLGSASASEEIRA